MTHQISHSSSFQKVRFIAPYEKLLQDHTSSEFVIPRPLPKAGRGVAITTAIKSINP